MHSSNAIALCLVVSCCSFASDRAASSLHGEATPLRNHLAKAMNSRLHQGAIWGFGNASVVVIRYDLAVPAARRDQDDTPWRPAWVNSLNISKGKADASLIQGGRIIVVFRQYDSKTCVLNDLAGPRILSEDARQQDLTAEVLSCGGVEESLLQMKVPAAWAKEIGELVVSK